MSGNNINTVDVAEALLSQHRNSNWQNGAQYPSAEKLAEAVRLISEVIFPEYLMHSSEELVRHRIMINLDLISTLMQDQIGRAMNGDSKDVTTKFISSIAEIKALLTTDVEALYKADPAASSYAEIVLCYPSIMAMTHHRIAHSLHKLGVPIIPRMISELAHSKSGIDIHPGATIDSYFAIDHVTGVVICETTII